MIDEKNLFIFYRRICIYEDVKKLNYEQRI